METDFSWVIVLLFSGILVGNVAAQRRRRQAVAVGKERRESLVRAKRLCRIGVSGSANGDGDGEGEGDVSPGNDMVVDEEQSVLEAQTSSAVQELKAAITYQYVSPRALVL